MRIRRQSLSMMAFVLVPTLCLGLAGCMSEEETEARKLDDRASELFEAGKYEEVIPLARQVLDMYREIKGEEHRDYAISLQFLALNYKKLGRYEEAEPLYIEALEVDRKRLGEQDASYPLNLSLVGDIHRLQEDYDEAERFLLEAVERQGALEKGRTYANYLNKLALLYTGMARYEEAISRLSEARDILGEIRDDYPEEYALSLKNLAYVYTAMGQDEKAAELLNEAGQIER